MKIQNLWKLVHQITGKNASGDTKAKYFYRLLDAFHHAERCDWKAAAHKLRGLKPKDHPFIQWLLDGIKSERFRADIIEGESYAVELGMGRSGAEDQRWKMLCACGYSEWHIACGWNHPESEICGPPTMATAIWFAQTKNRDYRRAMSV